MKVLQTRADEMHQQARPDVDAALAVMAVVRREEGFEGALSPSDIAEICGVSRQRIQQVEQVAMEKVRVRLGALGIDGGDVRSTPSKIGAGWSSKHGYGMEEAR